MDIKSIISQMTLEEKAGLCSGKNYWETKEIERLGIPSILMTDGPHGLRKIISGKPGGKRESAQTTCFPPAVLSACSFDRDLLYELGEAIADEAIAEGIGIILGPGVNIKRSPLCGRNFEYFSEDPYLAGEMAVAFIKGAQNKGVGTSLKHFAANNQETRRWSSDSRVDERTLREIYFPAFKKAVEEAQPATVMCSYNKVNGEYASENRRLLTEILREEWGFDGVVVSDWGAVNDRVKGLEAGLDLEMPGVAIPPNDIYIIEAVRSGKLKEEVLDIAVERLLKLTDRVNNINNTEDTEKLVTRLPDSGAAKKLYAEKHNSLARKIAAESIVLLKNNNGILPLKKIAKIVFIGEFAEKPRFQGAGSSQVNPVLVTSALEAASGYTEVSYCKGYNTNYCDDTEASLFTGAVSVAASADICVIFAGLPPAYESEGYDRTHMRLPDGQVKLIEAVADTNPNTVVVLHNGAPVEMPWIDKVSCVLEAYLGGQAGGAAVADILFGAVNPCGKLAETFPVKLSDNPSYLYYFGERNVTEYREGIFTGYRYYDTKEMEPLFPFGFGLSYTTFEYSNIKLSASTINDTGQLTVTADITNSGKIAGKEIVQLYVAKKEKDDRLIRADKELKGFVKIELEPGETKKVSFTLDKTAFAYYNTGINDWYVLPAVYEIKIGRSSRDIVLSADVFVDSTVKIPFKADENTPVRDIKRMKNGEAFIKELIELSPMFARLKLDPEPGTPEYVNYHSIPEMVLRQVFLMGLMPDMSMDDIKKMIDEKLNNE